MKYLYHNTMHPVSLLGNGVLKARKEFSAKGVSLSSNYSLSAFGAFKIVFRKSPWWKKLHKCYYGMEEFRGEYAESRHDLRIYKPKMFLGEKEWWSEKDIKFKETDVVKIIVMSNSPGARVWGKRYMIKQIQRLIVAFPYIPIYEDSRLGKRK